MFNYNFTLWTLLKSSSLATVPGDNDCSCTFISNSNFFVAEYTDMINVLLSYVFTYICNYDISIIQIPSMCRKAQNVSR